MQILEKAKFLQYQNTKMHFDSYEISTLSKISIGSQKMLKFFPFQDALNQAKKNNSQIGLDESLIQFYDKVWNRIEKNLIINRNYKYLINWYQDFKIEIKLIHKLKDNDGNPQVMQMFIDYSTGKINARIFTSGTTSTQIGASDVRDGKWHHAAIVYDGDTGEAAERRHHRDVHGGHRLAPEAQQRAFGKLAAAVPENRDALQV